MEGHFSHWAVAVPCITFGGLIKGIPTGHTKLGGIDINEGGCCDDAAASHLWQFQRAGFVMLP